LFPGRKIWQSGGKKRGFPPPEGLKGGTINPGREENTGGPPKKALWDPKNPGKGIITSRGISNGKFPAY